MNTPNPCITAVPDSGDAHSPDGCRHLTARGRRCRSRAVRSGFCFRHAALQLQSHQPLDVDLSADFLLQLDDLQSAEQINQFLGKLLILVVQNRISPRRAAVLTYITNQLLRSLVAIQREIDSEPPRFDWENCPRPLRDLPDSDTPVPQPAEESTAR
ncbi:MAG TPA: hypothetical protein VKQ28_08960 [Candidatus Acidoferrum sp.]|nr:hypothetical protein [Candidatus Acidoferrum sp.]